jgi:hypothetical protein
VGFAVLLSSPANAMTINPTSTGATDTATSSATIAVPSGFDKGLGDTRANGHYAVQGTSLHIWTTGTTSTDKVAEYVDTDTPLSAVGEPVLNFSSNLAGGGAPGYQLVVDLDGNGTTDGILVGEPGFYGTDWWLAGASKTFDYSAAPGAAYGYDHSGPLAQWEAAYPQAKTTAFGFSLGSGVHGDGSIDSIVFAGTSYTFSTDVLLTGKNDCKSGGWSTSTLPVYKNQGACVSHFAAGK